MNEAAAPVRIIGIGSPLGDDSVGWRIVDAWTEEPCHRRSAGVRAETVKLDGPPVALIRHLQGARFAIIVDAAVGKAPGTVEVRRSHEPAPDPAGLSTHGLGIAEALALAEAARLPVPPLRIVAVHGAAFTGDALSAPVRAAVPHALAVIARLVERGVGPMPGPAEPARPNP